MKRHGLYGVFVGTKWGMLRNKRDAIRLAKEHKGTVRRMDLPSCCSWDAPTFRVCSEQIADFRA